MGAVECHKSKRRTIDWHEQAAASAHDSIVYLSVLVYLDQLAVLIRFSPGDVDARVVDVGNISLVILLAH